MKGLDSCLFDMSNLRFVSSVISMPSELVSGDPRFLPWTVSDVVLVGAVCSAGKRDNADV